LASASFASELEVRGAWFALAEQTNLPAQERCTRFREFEDESWNLLEMLKLFPAARALRPFAEFSLSITATPTDRREC
jgi:hypothetical protein